MQCNSCEAVLDVSSKFCASCGSPVTKPVSLGINDGVDFEDHSKIFKRKFTKVFREMELLVSKVHVKEGYIFTNHIYNKEELLNSKHHSRIDSITGKIGSDAMDWHIRGKLPEEARIIYHELRNEVEDKLHEINVEIESRKPTWWEDLKGVLDNYIIWIMDNIPALSGWLLAAGKMLSKLPGPVGIVGGYIASFSERIIRISNKKFKQIEYKQS